MRRNNPLKKGYSRKTISDNIAEMVNGGMRQDRAVAAALKSGRRYYRVKYPKGPFPAHLQTRAEKVSKNPSKTVKGYLLAISDDKTTGYWTGTGFDTDKTKAVFYPGVDGAKGEIQHIKDEKRELYNAIHHKKFHFFLEPTSRRSNPVPLSRRAQIKQAQDLYADFTGHNPKYVDQVNVDFPAVGLYVGEVDGILYTTVRDGKKEKYIHKFKKAARPRLVVSSDGRQLVMLGGAFQFTERGIVDH